MFPATVTFVAGPGSFDTTTQTLTYTLSKVQPNESRTDTIRGQIVSLDKLPSDQAIKCDVNQATAGQTGQEASVSNAQFCIQKQLSQFPTTKGGLQIFPSTMAKSTPSTGPELIPLLALVPSAFAGLFLRRKSA